MPEPFEIDEMPYELKVNGLPVRSVHIRRVHYSVDDFQVVITDPQIGSFSFSPPRSPRTSDVWSGLD